MGALHLLNLSEHGIALQFQVLLLASLLWARLQQETTQRTAAAGAPPQRVGRATGAPLVRTLTGRLSRVLQVGWRLCQKALRVVRNCLAQPLSVYLVNCAELNM